MIKTIVARKHNSSSHAVYGIVTFSSSKNVTWLGDISSDKDAIYTILDGITTDFVKGLSEEELDMSDVLRQVLTVCKERCTFAACSRRGSARISRCITFYSRSDQVAITLYIYFSLFNESLRVLCCAQIPLISETIEHQEYPLAVIDVVYLHNKISTELEASVCRDAYSNLRMLTTAHSSLEHTDGATGGEMVGSTPATLQGYLFETHPSSLKLSCIGAALLAHPLQRLSQEEFLRRMGMDSAGLESLRHSLTQHKSSPGPSSPTHKENTTSVVRGEGRNGGESSTTNQSSRGDIGGGVEGHPEDGKSGQRLQTKKSSDRVSSEGTSRNEVVSSSSGSGNSDRTGGKSGIDRVKNFFSGTGNAK